MRNLWAYLSVLIAFVLIACGGSKDMGSRAMGTARASATFTVQWPEANGRFIANRATHVSMTVLRKYSAIVLGKAGASRPASGTTSQLVIGELPADEVVYISVTAEDQTGTPLSSAGGDFTLKPGQNALTFTLASVVDSIEITPANPTVAVGDTLPLNAVGKSGSAIVLSTNGDFVWSSSSPSVATVDPATGLVAGVSNGLVAITALQAGNEFNAEHAQTIQVTVGSGLGSTGGGTTGGAGGIFNFTGTAQGDAVATGSFTSVQVPGISQSTRVFRGLDSGVVSLKPPPDLSTIVFTVSGDTLTVSFNAASDGAGGIATSFAATGTVSGTGIFAPYTGRTYAIASNTLPSLNFNTFSINGD